MNPLTNVKNIKKLSEQELKIGGKSSWHDQYRDSAWIFVGGLPYDLTEGDVICIFSQYGEIVNINLVRDKDTGKQKGFCFICYEDQKSTILAVDNLNSIKILGRTLRVDHVENYKAPKESKKNPVDDETRLLREEGCAPAPIIPSKPKVNNEYIDIDDDNDNKDGIKLPPRLPIGSIKVEGKKSKKKDKKKEKKSKKSKKEKKQKKKRKYSDSSEESDSDNDSRNKKSKKDKLRKKRKDSSSSSSDDGSTDSSSDSEPRSKKIKK